MLSDETASPIAAGTDALDPADASRIDRPAQPRARIDPPEAIRAAMFSDRSLRSLVFKSPLTSANPYRQVTVRPVQVRGQHHWQFTYLTEKQDITKNYTDADAPPKIDDVLALPFGTIQFESTVMRWTAQITRKGKVIIHDLRLAAPNQDGAEPPAPAHDHEKDLLLPVGRPDPFLIETGIMDQAGRIRPAMHAKFAQINAFLTLLEQTDMLDKIGRSPVEILDCGCGSAYLSFAAYHYLNDVRGIPARLTGIDYNGKLIEKDNQSANALGYPGACFLQSAIIDYVPSVPPDILLALHACDTATDEAIAQGVRAQSALILCAPCCHHELRHQLDEHDAPDPMGPILRHGIVKQRMAELLTDSLRALLLRILSYKTEVVEFVSPEHTDKNLMIRAVRRPDLNRSAAIAEYKAVKAYWGGSPMLETLLAAELAAAGL